MCMCLPRFSDSCYSYGASGQSLAPINIFPNENMTITVKNKTDLVVPAAVRRRAGIKPGDQLEFKVSGGVITIVPKLPSANDEYTPEQRRIIDARLAESAED